MVYSEVENKWGFSASDVHAYREATGASMEQAKKHFMDVYRFQRKAEMVELIESGSLEDIREVVKILLEDY